MRMMKNNLYRRNKSINDKELLDKANQECKSRSGKQFKEQEKKRKEDNQTSQLRIRRCIFDPIRYSNLKVLSQSQNDDIFTTRQEYKRMKYERIIYDNLILRKVIQLIQIICDQENQIGRSQQLITYKYLINLRSVADFIILNQNE
ncbi:unnamed protein product [Paramecium pentaurelia]|uniref:Uncharacterized protein n=1 Tax=Paramecium pentaurelia TaxID=43138 RepID=A0A8S1YI98_9CILI|nr:unnamed protein product [Paramecium pentaurelia]